MVTLHGPLGKRASKNLQIKRRGADFGPIDRAESDGTVSRASKRSD